MTEAGFYQQKKMSPVGVATVVLLHGAALTALLTAKMEMPGRQIFGHTEVFNVPVPPPPPPPPTPIKQPPKQQQAQDTHLTTVQTVFHPIDDHFTLPLPPPQPVPTPETGTAPLPLPPPQPPAPPQRTFEPARAHANLSSYVSDADYPDAALRNDEQGTTRFRLTVGADGRVTGCTVTGSSGSSALDAATCRLMKGRARFTPARDSSGNATTDSVASAIRWVLPAG